MAIGCAVIIGHLLVILIALNLGWRQKAPAASLRLTALDISVAAEPSEPAQPARTLEVQRVSVVERLPSTIRVPMHQTASGSGEGAGCATALLVARAIAESPEAMAALAALPSNLRTEADAVMLWNGSWELDSPSFDFLTSSEEPFEVIKQVVIDALIASPAECLEVETSGPQIIPVQEPNRTTMLVFGSGVWRWSSVVNPPISAEPADENLPANEISIVAHLPTGN